MASMTTFGTAITQKTLLVSHTRLLGKLLPDCQYNIKAWPVDHSIPGAMAYAVETSEGWIVYTGDLRLHGSKGNLTRAFSKRQLNCTLFC